MKIKEKPQEFIVEEITSDGLVLEVGRDWVFSRSEGEHLICVLEKINWDTNRAIKLIAKRLHVSPKRIGFAGTKDKRAWTTQRISIWGITVDDITKVKLKDLWLKPIAYSSERIKLGDLWGNRFTITIKDLSQNDIEKFVLPEKFRVPNYFGVQRFGEKRPMTHLVGRALVLGNVEEAVKLYLAWVGPGEREETKEARHRLKENWNWKEALSYFPSHLSYERTLLEHLAKNPNDYANALRRLPKNLLKMFVHAYQSYLFNRYLDARLDEIGLDPTDGDILVDETPTGPLYGYEMKMATGKPGEIERNIISDEGVSLDSFRIQSLPEASSKGSRRKVYSEVLDYRLLDKGHDWVRVQFRLRKGSYATTVLDWILGIKHKIPDTKNLWADDDTQGS